MSLTLIGVEVVLVDMGEMGREREHSWLDRSKFLKLSFIGRGEGGWLCLLVFLCLRLCVNS